MLQPRDIQDGSTDLATLRGWLASGEAAEDVAGPLLAGARARHVADLCDAMSLPVLLMDRNCRVLHATALAQAAISGVLDVVHGRVLAREARANASLQQFIDDILAHDPDGASVTIGPHRRPVSMAAVHTSDDSAYQLLHTVVLIGRTVAEVRDGANRLAAALAANRPVPQ